MGLAYVVVVLAIWRLREPLLFYDKLNQIELGHQTYKEQLNALYRNNEQLQAQVEDLEDAIYNNDLDIATLKKRLKELEVEDEERVKMELTLNNCRELVSFLNYLIKTKQTSYLFLQSTPFTNTNNLP
eukprot:TRINITY_DN23769_c0_g1_i1.p1 TRINITY_DN23769_c0_g1~~TRINITY_DN23769_c0_g1_i1.p1  ORF type:complete len:142 (-),score=38.78 TRINITY_DN23769_c0_g1_i1:160-543(-)